MSKIVFSAGQPYNKLVQIDYENKIVNLGYEDNKIILIHLDRFELSLKEKRYLSLAEYDYYLSLKKTNIPKEATNGKE